MAKAQAPFHAGEIEVQERAGVPREAARIGGGIQFRLSAPVARFLARQPLAVAATVDASGRPWASPLTAAPGFLHAVDDHLLRIAVAPAEGDPLAANLRARPEMGLLVIDLATRQRVRVNGRAILEADSVWLETEQVYGNCPKYIQRRSLSGQGATGTSALRYASLRSRDREAIARADTFFIASVHPDAGADASHRGGRPGFVRLIDDTHLAFDDYPGNNMFNTLGNLVAYPRAGLLFLDFATGDVLQTTGRTEVRFDRGQRELRVQIEDVVARAAAVPLRWRLEEPSPFNP